MPTRKRALCADPESVSLLMFPFAVGVEFWEADLRAAAW